MKKRKERKKTYELAAASRLALVSGKAQRAQIQEEGGQTCKEREWSAGKKKKKGKPVARAPCG